MLRIMMATDFSRAAEAAYRYCLMLAAGMPCHITVIHVYKQRLSGNLSVDQANVFVQKEKLEHMDRARRFSGMYPDIVKPEIVSQCKVETLVAEGPVSDTILEEARRHEADVIVIGSKKHPGILKSWFGQISATLIYSRTCPVLVVPEDNIEVGVDRIGLVCLNASDEDRLVRWQEKTSLPIEHPVVCRFYGGGGSDEGYESLRVQGKANADGVLSLNETDCHLFAVMTSEVAGDPEKERKNFVHQLYRRSKKPFLCLNV